MDSIGQRLRELDRADFEKLCFHLMNERHPSAGVRHVEGAAGDLGADCFAGDLDKGPVVWQAKAFANGVGKSQKEQIRQSLKRAIDELRPACWCLCVPIDLDISTHRWFQRLKQSYASKAVLCLVQGSDIVGELMHRKSLRDHFFPGAALDVSELRALLTRTGECSEAQLAALTQENAQQYIERLKNRDARFNYEIVISSDRKPSVNSSGSQPLFSIDSGSIVVNAYPRDPAALQLDPPKIKFRFSEAGAAKFKDFMSTGRAQSLGPGEAEVVNTTLCFPQLQGALENLKVGRSISRDPIPTRLTFGVPRRCIQYDFVQFKLERVGADEVEILSTGKLPFTIRLVVRRGGGDFHLTEQWEGASFLAVKKYIDALTALIETHELEVYDLKSERRLFCARINIAESVAIDPKRAAFISDGARIANAFCNDLLVPWSVERGDAETFFFLRNLLDGTIDGLDDVSSTIAKETNECEWLTRISDGQPTSLTMQNPGLECPFNGRTISTGPFELVLDQVLLIDSQESVRRYRQLPIGSEIQLRWKPTLPPRVVLSNRQQ